ncbi:Small ribosomal subunit biogenesis [Lecanora helva]
MKVSSHSAVPVYTISGSSTARPLPEWLARKRKRSLKQDPEYANRIEDFEYDESSQCVRVSDDGQWVMSTGTYKPQIHTHYLPHLSLSFARHTVSLNTTFLLLSSDYSKSLHLQSDRSIEFHTPLGCHYSTRLPRYGRDLQYEKRSTEALIPSVGLNENGKGEVFRLNLEAGRFMRSYEIEVGGDSLMPANGSALQGGITTGSVNTAAIAEESHNLLAFGTSVGTVEFWDQRSRGCVGILQLPRQPDLIDGNQETTALQFDRTGLGIATGSSTGLIHLYDLRSPNPILKKDQGYGYPIHTLTYLDSSTNSQSVNAEPKILSADKRIIKIWNRQDGSAWTSVEPFVDINSVSWCKDSGLLLTANEGRQQHSFFIPQLGPAPKWCAFLDNMVEEMAEDPNDPNAYTSHKAGDVYDNYKFLTPPQLESLNLSHLVGTTSLLRPYMHGYFVAQRLYEEAKLIANPFVWEEERDKKLKDKIDTERESRIRGTKKVTAKVNKKLAEKMMERAEREDRRQAKRVLETGGDDNDAAEGVGDKKLAPGGLLSDPRFSRLFQDEDFAIDERSKEFQSLNPNKKPKPMETSEGNQGRLTAAEEEALAQYSGTESSDFSETSEEEGEEEEVLSKPTDSGRISSASYQKSNHRARQPQMQVTSSNRSHQAKDRSFGSRTERSKTSKPQMNRVVGEREITFAPQPKEKRKPEEPAAPRRDMGRRSASGNVFRKM